MKKTQIVFTVLGLILVSLFANAQTESNKLAFGFRACWGILRTDFQ